MDASTSLGINASTSLGTRVFLIKPDPPVSVVSEVGQPPPLTASGDVTSIAIALVRENGSLGVVLFFLLAVGWFLDFKGIFKDVREGFHSVSKIDSDIELLNSQVKARYNLIEEKQIEFNQKLRNLEQTQQEILLKISTILDTLKNLKP